MNWTFTKPKVELLNSKKYDIAVYWFEKIIDSFPGNLYWKDQYGVYLGCNKNMLKVSGLKTKEDIVGKSDDELWPKSALDIKRNDELVLKDGEIREQEECVNGLTYLSIKKPLYDEKNNIVGIVGNSIDITHLKQVESLLKRSNQFKTEFLRNMRHDIRTPLTGIINCAKLLKDMKGDTSKVEQYAEILIESGESLLRLLTDVLEVIQIDSEELPVLKQRFCLHSILEEVIKINRAKAVEKQLQFALDHDPLIPEYLIGDPKRLYRIVLELVNNALKYTNQGYVRVSTELIRSEDRELIIKILVEDTGIGIPADQTQEIFQQFKRLAPSFQGTYQGSGLGLYLVRQFLNDLKAEIHVISEINQGSTFICVFPLQKALLEEKFYLRKPIQQNENVVSFLAATKNPTPAVVPSCSHKRVLVVEDFAIIAKCTQDMLSNLNHQVDLAESGERAIVLTEQHDYDLIFMDIGLPNMDGIEATRQIRRNPKNKLIPIVGLTAHLDAESIGDCLTAGMNQVFIKPLSLEQIPAIFETFFYATNELSFREKDKNVESLISVQGSIDLILGKELVGGKESLAEELINMFVSGLPKELKKIDDALQEHDWETVRKAVHKLRGGLSYCGLPRLKEACIRLNEALKNQEEQSIAGLYQEFLLEFDRVKKILGSAVTDST